MANPLRTTRDDPRYARPVAATPQEEAAARNARISRDDIEWAVNAQGQIFLQYRADWTRQHTIELARKAEHDRQQWKRNNGERV